jgi:hypothetical protein
MIFASKDAAFDKQGLLRFLVFLQYCSRFPSSLKFLAIHQSSIALSHARALEAPLEKPAEELPERFSPAGRTASWGF